MLINYYGDSDS